MTMSLIILNGKETRMMSRQPSAVTTIFQMETVFYIIYWVFR